MRTILQAFAVGLALAGSVSGAQAGWSGCRIGVQAGAINSASSLTSNPGSVAPLLKADGTSAMGGVEAGCDVGLPFMVVGIGASYDFMNAVQKRTHTEVVGTFPATVTTSATVHSQSRGIATLSGRAGFDLGPFLLFGRLGYAVAPQKSRYTFSSAHSIVGTVSTDLSVSHWRAGYVLGLGVEMQVGPAVLKVEYDHFDFGTRNALMRGLYNAPRRGNMPISSRIGNAFSVDTLRAGVAYRF